MIVLNKMSKKNMLFVGLAISALCMTSCSKQPDFDAKSYVKSSLDAEYHGTYADYANLMEISEEDVKKQVEEDFNESMDSIKEKDSEQFARDVKELLEHIGDK